MKKTIQLMAATAISAALIFAQGPGGRGQGAPPDPARRIEMRVNMLARQLSLTDDQKTQATKIFTDANTAGETARTGIQTARQSMSDAVKTNNTASIDQLSRDIGNYTGQLVGIESKAEAAFYMILNADQKAKFDTTRGMGQMGGGPAPAGFRRGN